ncbi:uncharacterized protein CEXT_12551 [Caerostris extrusa]|uniref:Uncharacterized protein n=1 Tax=Caerostris extrusa TaxID=172846 RepID=A0AAV4PDA8_CAEEX|nr:uncharacterized protein CEXT_12551 [Caerostris extrusa]
MTISFVLSLVLVYSIIMCLSVQDNAEKLHGVNCKVDELFSSAYVTPVVDQPTEVTGCHSHDTTSDERVNNTSY